MIKYEYEDEADRWLREHDPYYTSKIKGKMQKEKYPYETPELRHKRAQMEIPLSCLSMKQAFDIGAVVSEDGESWAVEL